MGRVTRRKNNTQKSVEFNDDDIDVDQDDDSEPEQTSRSQQQNIKMLQAKLSRKRKRTSKQSGAVHFDKKASQIEKGVLQDLKGQLDKFTTSNTDFKQTYQKLLQTIISDSIATPSTLILCNKPSSSASIIKVDYTKHPIYLRQQEQLAIADNTIANVVAFNGVVCELQERVHAIGQGWEAKLETARTDVEEMLESTKDQVGQIFGFRTKKVDAFGHAAVAGDGQERKTVAFDGLTWMDRVATIKKGVHSATKDLPYYEDED